MMQPPAAATLSQRTKDQRTLQGDGGVDLGVGGRQDSQRSGRRDPQRSTRVKQLWLRNEPLEFPVGPHHYADSSGSSVFACPSAGGRVLIDKFSVVTCSFYAHPYRPCPTTATLQHEITFDPTSTAQPRPIEANGPRLTALSCLRGVALGGASAGLGCLLLTVLGRRRGREVGQQGRRRGRDGVDGSRKRLLVGPGRLGESADLADVLERGRVDLFPGRRRLEVVESSDVSAHTPRLARPAGLHQQT